MQSLGVTRRHSLEHGLLAEDRERDLYERVALLDLCSASQICPNGWESYDKLAC